MSSNAQFFAQGASMSGTRSGASWGIRVAGLLWGLWAVGTAFGGLPGPDGLNTALPAIHVAGALAALAVALLPAARLWLAGVAALALLGFSALPHILSQSTDIPVLVICWAASVGSGAALGALARSLGDRLEDRVPPARNVLAVVAILLLGPVLWGVGAFSGQNGPALSEALQVAGQLSLIAAAALSLVFGSQRWLFGVQDWAGLAALLVLLGLSWAAPALGVAGMDLPIGLLALCLLMPLPVVAVLILMVGTALAFWPQVLTALSGVAPAPELPLAAVLLAILILLLRGAVQDQGELTRRSRDQVRHLAQFAQLGLFQVDPVRGEVLADIAAAQLLGTSRRFPLSDLKSRFGDSPLESLATQVETGAGGLLRLSVQGQHGPLELALWRNEAGLVEGALRALQTADPAAAAPEPESEEPVPSSTMEALHELQARQAEAEAAAADAAPVVQDIPEPSPEPEVDAFSQLYARSMDLHDAEQPVPLPDVVRENVRPIALLEKLKDELAPEAAEKDVALDILVGDGAFEETLCPAQDIRQALILMFREAMENDEVTTISLGFDTQVRPEETRRIWTLEDDGEADPAPLQNRSKLARLVGLVEADLRHRRFATGLQRQDLVFASRAPVKAHPTRHPAHVLLVEDHTALRDAMAQTLRRTFAHVTAVADGKTAWAAYRSTRPDLVLVDLGVPGLAGDALLQQIRAQDPAIPAFGLVASAGGREDKKLRAAGATDVLVKPLHEDALQRLHKSVAR